MDKNGEIILEKFKKGAGIFLSLTFLILVLYGFDYFPMMEPGDSVVFEKMYVIVDLESPTEGTFYITEQNRHTRCPHELDYYEYAYSNAFVGILSLQYKGTTPWEDTKVANRQGRKSNFTAKEPQMFKFKTASFTVFPMKTDADTLYQDWKIKVIFPKGYEVDTGSCEGAACETVTHSRENGRDVMEFQTNAVFGLKVLYRYVGD
jgi:hypothetical protein